MAASALRVCLVSPHARPRFGRLLLVAAGLLAVALAPAPERAAADGPDRLTSRPRPPAPKATALAVGEEVRTAAGQRRRLALPGGATLYVNAGTTARLEADRRLRLTAGE